MSEGDVVIVPMEMADGTLKPRPGIVLRSMPPFGDPLICAVSSQLHQEVLGFDEPIVPGDADFSSSGLRAPSLIRLGYLVMKSRRQIAGRIGFIDPKRAARLREKLSAYLRKAGS
jgi:mRNA interferase MazF